MTPTHCDICGRTFANSGVYIDGRTKGGPWGIMCLGCFGTYGVGLGVACGQRYTYNQVTKVWLKTTG